jgi:hypothetical protein
MGLYLGSSEKLKVVSSNTIYCLNLLSTMPVVTEIRLLSSDGYILKDSNDLYLITKEDELYGNRI